MDAKKNKSFMYIFIVVAIIFLVFFASEKIAFVFNVFSPVLAGIVVAYLLDGMIRFFTKKIRIKRNLAIALVILIVFAFGGLTTYFAVPFLVDATSDLIEYISDLLMGHDNGLYNLVSRVAYAVNIDLSMIDVNEVDNTLINALNGFIQNISGMFVNFIVSIGSSIINIITVAIMAIYMLIEKDSLLKWLKRLVKAVLPERQGEYVLKSFSMANRVFKKFVIGKLMDSSIIAILCLILFSIFRIEYAVLFSIITGAGNMIPYFGPIFFAVPVVLILLIINPQHAIIALIIIIVVQQLDNNVIGPKVLGDNVGVSAFWILFAVTVCGMAFGFVGMIIGVPLVVIVKNLIEDFVEMRLKQREFIKNTSETLNDSEETEVVYEVAEKQ